MEEIVLVATIINLGNPSQWYKAKGERGKEKKFSKKEEWKKGPN